MFAVSNSNVNRDRRAEQQALDQARLETFVVRARRIAAHSLTQDMDRLRSLSRGAVQVTLTPGSPTATISYDYPPEEVVESAAARVRPLLLNDVSMLSVLKAVASLTASSPDRELVRVWAGEVRKAWKRRTDEQAPEPGYFAMFENSETGEQSATDARKLALAWVYGDVVHHDASRLTRTRHWDVGDRYRAAVPMIAYMMVEALNVLENVRELDRRGHLTVAAEAWSVDVVAEAHYTREATIHVGEPGAAGPANASDPLGPEWTPLVLAAADEQNMQGPGEHTADASGDVQTAPSDPADPPATDGPVNSA